MNVLTIQATDILVYFLYPLEDFLSECVQSDFFRLFFLFGVACMAIIGVIHIVRRFIVENFRRRV